MNANHSSVKNIETLEVYDRGIESLEGIEYFTGLVTLWCQQNNLTILDMSKNSELQGLLYYNNKLTELNINRNNNLTHLICSYNRLEELDLRDMRNYDNFNLTIYGNDYYPSSRRRLTRLKVNDWFKDHTAVERVKRLRGDNVLITVYDNNNENEITCYNYDPYSGSGGGNCIETDNWVTFSDNVLRNYIKSLIPGAFDERGRINAAHQSVLTLYAIILDRSTIRTGEINSLEDLKYFERLGKLEVNMPVNITSLDLSKNTNLSNVKLFFPDLDELDITGIKSSNLMPNVSPIESEMGNSIGTLKIDYIIRENPAIRRVRESYGARIRVYNDEGTEVCPDYNPISRTCTQPFSS